VKRHLSCYPFDTPTFASQPRSLTTNVNDVEVRTTIWRILRNSNGDSFVIITLEVRANDHGDVLPGLASNLSRCTEASLSRDQLKALAISGRANHKGLEYAVNLNAPCEFSNLTDSVAPYPLDELGRDNALPRYKTLSGPLAGLTSILSYNGHAIERVCDVMVSATCLLESG
jgi:hypothetical protein